MVFLLALLLAVGPAFPQQGALPETSGLTTGLLIGAAAVIALAVLSAGMSVVNCNDSGGDCGGGGPITTTTTGTR